jgi:hypothetical protein
MSRKKAKPKYRALIISLIISAIVLSIGIHSIEDLDSRTLIARLFWPLLRLMVFIGIGLAAGQLIEASGWTRAMAALAMPAFRFGNLGQRCSAAFTTAFFSGVAANAMLLEFYKEGKISRQQLFLSNFTNQLPGFFLHLPTTFFIVIPLTKWAGALYFLLTFLATLFRTFFFLLYGHVRLTPSVDKGTEDRTGAVKSASVKKGETRIWQAIKSRLPTRLTNIAVYVVPIYIAVFILNSMGLFDLARKWLAGYVATTFIPIESLSVVILSFAAEFTSGFAAAGALLDAGVLTTKQTVMALLIGNVVAFPIRALRHQLPHYMGIYSPKMGTQLLLMGQGFRVLSVISVGLLYYFLT